MGNYNIVKLNFLGPLHIGKGIGDYYDMSNRMLHSDTISGAIASTFVSLFGEESLVDFMASYRVSSAFPFCENHFFLPKPQGIREIYEITSSGNVSFEGKDEKKIEFIDIALFNNFAEKGSIVLDRKWISKCGKFVFSNIEANGIQLYKNMLVQRAFVPRGGCEDTVPFFFERIFFRENCGLYFIFDVSPNWENAFKQTVINLGITGVGTDKNVGNGQFDAEFDKIKINSCENGSFVFLLSLYCPEKEELNTKLLQESNYQLIKRGGFISGAQNSVFWHLRKKSIYFFNEGSVLNANSLKGKIENLRPAWNDGNLHAVYRDGRAFGIGLNLKKEEVLCKK